MKRRIQYQGLAQGIVVPPPPAVPFGYDHDPAEIPVDPHYVILQTGGWPEGILGPAQEINTGPLQEPEGFWPQQFPYLQTGGFAEGIIGPAQETDTGPFRAEDFQPERPVAQMAGGAAAIFVAAAVPDPTEIFLPEELPLDPHFVIKQTGGWTEGILGPAQEKDTGPFAVEDFHQERPLPQMAGGADAIFVSSAPAAIFGYNLESTEVPVNPRFVIAQEGGWPEGVLAPLLEDLGPFEVEVFPMPRPLPLQTGGTEGILGPAQEKNIGPFAVEDFHKARPLPQMAGGADAVFVSAAVEAFGYEMGPAEMPPRPKVRFIVGGIDLGFLDVAPPPLIDWAPEPPSDNVALRINRAIGEPCVEKGLIGVPATFVTGIEDVWTVPGGGDTWTVPAGGDLWTVPSGAA